MNWIKCSERLPPVESGDPEYGASARVLIWHPNLRLGPVTSFYFYGDRVWCDDEAMGPLPERCQATHWMPLPDPPISERVQVANTVLDGSARPQQVIDGDAQGGAT